MSLEQKVVELLGQLQEVAKPAATIAVQATRADAIASLISGALGAGVFIVTLFVSRKILSAADVAGKDWADVPHVIISAGLILFISGLFALEAISPWNWIALFNPELALAHSILEKIGK